MQRIAYSKKIICYLFILCIALTSTFSANGECGVFSMQRQQTCCSKQTVQVDSFQNAKAEHYLHMIQTSFAKEDCRIEDGSANTMQKLNLIREQKTVSISKFERICYCLTDCYARCVSIMHNQYILKATLIINRSCLLFIGRTGRKSPQYSFFDMQIFTCVRHVFPNYTICMCIRLHR